MPPVIAGLSDPAEIGRGGFGIVYRAHDERFDREVALKVIRDPGLSDEVVARFARECKSLGSLSGHPNIVSIYDAGQTADGELYLVMEYLTRGSLAQRITGEGPADAEEVVAWGAALAGALETAHRGGIVHRDVKPENVLFSPFGAPKLVDFGIARMRTAFETRSGSVSATLSHAAPEIIGGTAASAQSDVYSLASVLFYALTGSAPFDRPGEESLAPLIARIATAEPPDLREAGIPGPLADAVAAGLAKDPDDRPASAAAFGALLQEAAASLGLAVPEVPVSDVPPVGSLFELSPGERPTPRIGTVQVARKREAPPELVTAGTSPRRRARLGPVLVAALGVLALLGVGLGVLAPWRSGDAAATTPLRLADDVVHTDAGLDYTRSYAVSDDGKRIGSSVRLVNSGEQTIKQAWFEVIPPALARSVDGVRFTPKPDGAVDGALAVYWVLDLSPGEERTLGWTVALPSDAHPSPAYLREVRGDVARAAVAAQPATDAKRAELARTDGVSATEPQPVDTPVVASGQDAGGVPGAVPGGSVPGGSVPGGSVPGGSVPAGGATGGNGTTSGGQNAPAPGGGTSGGSNGGTQAGAPAPAPATNHAPTISASNQSSNELASPSVAFGASDPDGDGVTISVSGLPAGLSASNGRVSGTISANAASVTTDRRQGIRSKGFPVTITATDSRGASNSTTVTWTVADTHTTMPNYVGKFGCGNTCGEGSMPDVAALSSPVFDCVLDSAGDGNHIARQGVAAGQVVAWGQSIQYWYGDPNCGH